MAGASSGIGEACAWRFAEAGCRLVLVARRQDRLESLKQALQKEYGSDLPIHTVAMDVRDTEAVVSLPDRLPEGFAEVDILVNNAGLALGLEPADHVDLEDARTMIDSNIMGVISFTKAFGPAMRKRNKGHIVNMGSIAGHEAYANGSVYCATKHALRALTTSARHEFVGTNVRVTLISPGAVKTEFSVVRFKGDNQRADDVYKGIDPLVAADIADNVLYAVTRPPHVQIADMVILATNQSGAGVAKAKLPDKS